MKYVYLLISLLALTGATYLGLQQYFAASSPQAKAKTNKESYQAALHETQPAPFTLAQLNTSGLPPDQIDTVRNIVIFFETGNYAAALRTLRTAANQYPATSAFGRWIQAQLPNVLLAEGWRLLKSNQCHNSINLLREASNLTNNPAVNQGLAFCYYQLNNYTTANEYFAKALTLNPGDLKLSELYADSLESDLQFDQAVEVLTIAAAANPNNPGLRNSLSAMISKAKESPQQQQHLSQHFRILFRSEEHAAIISQISELLENSLGEYIHEYGFHLPKKTIDVILYPEQSFRGSASGALPPWAAGLYDGRIRLYLQENETDRLTRRVERSLRHELVHALVAAKSNQRSLPTWFNEGLAQLLECLDTLCSLNLKTLPAKRDKFLSLEDLQGSFLSFDSHKATRAYQQSHFMLQHILIYSAQPKTETLRQIIAQINETSDLTSEHLLTPLDLDFAQLYAKVAATWANSKVTD